MRTVAYALPARGQFLCCAKPERAHSASCSTARESLSVKIARVAAAVTISLSPQLGLHNLPANAQDVLVFDHDQTLVGADFSGRKDLVGAIFSKSNATRSNFSNADLRNAQLDDTVLIEATLDNAGKCAVFRCDTPVGCDG